MGLHPCPQGPTDLHQKAGSVMPLYTYVAIYEGTSYIAQQRRGNYQGFGDWIQALPAALKKKAAQNMYAGFEPITNRKNVWQKDSDD